MARKPLLYKIADFLEETAYYARKLSDEIRYLAAEIRQKWRRANAWEKLAVVTLFISIAASFTPYTWLKELSRVLLIVFSVIAIASRSVEDQ